MKVRKIHVGRNGSKNYTNNFVDRSRHNGIKGAKATNQILAHTFSHGTLDSVVS